MAIIFYLFNDLTHVKLSTRATASSTSSISDPDSESDGESEELHSLPLVVDSFSDLSESSPSLVLPSSSSLLNTLEESLSLTVSRTESESKIMYVNVFYYPS
jgi:hypothetical protein